MVRFAVRRRTSSGRRRHLTRMVGVLATGLALASTAACGSSDSDSSKGGDDASASASVADAKEALAPYYKIRVFPIPTEGPSAAAGKRIWIVSCGQQSPGCAAGVDAGKTAAEALGWTVNVADGNFGQNDGYSKGIRQAVAAKADAVLLYGFSCESVTAAANDAQEAGVKIVSTLACGDDGTLTLAADVPDPVAYNQLAGELSAWKVIEETDGKANVLLYNISGEETSEASAKGFTSVIDKCASCSVKQIDVPIQNLGPQLGAKVQSDLLANGNANAIQIPYASVYELGVKAGLARVNRDIFVMSAQQSTSLYSDMHASGKVTLGTVTTYSPGQESWAAIDQLNRLLNGEPVVPEGAFIGVTDAENNLPAEGEAFDSSSESEFFTTKFPYQDAYKKLWNGS